MPAYAEVTVGQGSTNVTIQWNGSGTGNICVTATNTTCNSTSPPRCLLVTTTATPATPGPISGDANTCTGDQRTYTIAAVSGATGYTWTVPPNAILISGQNTTTLTLRWDTEGVENLCVTASNSCGASDPAQCLSVTTATTPTQPGLISGSTTPCTTITEDYTIADVLGADTYNWTVSANGSIQGGQGTTTLNVLWTGTGAGTVCVTASSTLCGTSPQRCLTVVTTAPPATPGPISGDANTCTGDQRTYTIAAVSGATGYDWTIPPNATYLSGQNMTALTLRWDTEGVENLCVTATNSCGASDPAQCLTVTTAITPTQPGPISGSTSPCTGIAEDYTIAEVLGADTYNWTVSANGSIQGGQGSTMLNVLWSGTGAGTVCVTASSTLCGNSPQRCLPVAIITQPATPGPISGDANTCTGDQRIYSIASVSGATSYDWTIPANATPISGQNTTALTLRWDTEGTEDLCVTASNACGTSDPAQCLSVMTTAPPDAPDAITGTEEVCVGAIETYSILPVTGATGYNWAVPIGAVILSGQGSESLSVRWNTASTGKIRVRAQNACGNSTYTELSVTSYAVPTTPIFLAGNFAPCENTMPNYGVTPQPAFLDYQWTYNSGGNIAAGQGTASITMDWLGAGDGELCVTATSAVCNVERSACKSVVIRLLPAIPEYDNSDDVLCVGDTGVYVLNPVQGAVSYNWTASGGQFVGTQTGSTVKIKWPVATFTTMEVSANNSCGTGPINYGPTVLVSQPPAQPGMIAGLTTVCQGSIQLYSIAPVPDAESYTWTLPVGAVIQGGQGTASVSIKFNALGGSSVCVRAKTLFCESPTRCLNVMVGASVGNPGPVDGPSVVCQNSVAVYSVAQVLGATGYLWTLPPGATFVGGNNTASVTLNFAAAASGQVCVSALSACGASATSCKAVAIGSSWVPNISGATSFCTGDSTRLDAGSGYTTYTWAGPNGFSANSQRPTVNNSGTYTVTVSAGGCTGTASVTVSVSTSLSPTIVGLAAFCTGGTTTLLAGSGYTSYAWSGPLGFTASTQQITVSETGTYTVLVSSASGCTGAGMYTLANYALPTPTIVGPSSVCVGDTAVLDAGAGYTAYAWSNATTLRTLLVASIGAYTVTVTDGNGCTGTDNQTVVVNGLAPPSCQSTLTLPMPNSTSVPTTTTLQWKSTPGCVDGYHLSLGTTPGGSDLLNNQVVTDTFYQPAPPLPPGLLVYVLVVPFNVQGEASGCGAFSFKTAEVSTCDAASDSLELVKLHTATNGLGWANLWDLAKPVSTWYGVTVAAGCVTEIDLSANKLSGSLPDLNLPGLQILECDRNDLDGTIPNFAYAPKLKQFKCYDNQFTFEDILPNYPTLQSKLNVLNYNSQDSVFHDTLLIRNIGENLDFDLDFDNNIGSNLYRWYQDGTPQPAYDQSGNNKLIIPNLDLSHAGIWRVQVNNTVVPDLTLYSRGIRLQINCVADATTTATKTALCPNESVLLSATPQQVGNTYAWYRNGSPLPSGNGSTFSATQIGDYQVLVTNAAGCDSLSPVLSLSLAPSVVPSISSIPDGTVLGCTKTEITLAATGGDTYSWAGPGGFTANGQQSTANSPGTYTVTATSAATGCTGTAVLEITQDIAPPTATAAGDVLTCKTTEVTLTGNSGAIAADYNWVGPNGFTASSQQPTASSPGTYTLTVRDPANGCTNTATASVTQQINPPGATASVSGIISCTQLLSNLQGNTPTPGATYAWVGPNGYTANGQQPTASSPGTYTLTATGPNGCTSTATVEVSGSSDVPIASATGGAVDCNQPSTVLAATSSIVGSTYAWTGPNGFTANTQQPNASEPGTYTVVVTATPGCTATSTAILEDKRQAPDVAAEGGTLPCSPQEIVLQGASITPNVTYSWVGPNSFTAQSQQPQTNSPGVYTLTVLNTDTGCTNTATASVTSNSIFPSAIITTPNGLSITCLQPALPLEAPSGTSSIDYTWTKPDGSTATGPALAASNPGTYTLTASDTTTGCTAASTTTVLGKTNPPDISAAGGTLTCVLDSVMLVGTSATPGATYAWAGPNNYTATGQQPTANVQGGYTLTVTDPTNGCTASSTASIFSDKKPPVASIAPPQTITCALLSVTLQGTGGGDYAWAGLGAGMISNTQQATANAPGTYTVTVTAANGCTATDTATVGLDQAVPASVSATGGSLNCALDSLTLLGNAATPGVTYAWAGPSGFTASGPMPNANSTGLYTVTVTAANGCTVSATATVSGDIVPPLVTVATPIGAEINCLVSGAILKASGGNDYIWSRPDGSQTAGQQIIASIQGVYTCTVAGANGCTATATAVVSENKTPPSVTAPDRQLACSPEPFQTVLLAEVSAGSADFKWLGPGPNNEKSGENWTVYAAGVYTVTATDQGNGCTATQTVTVLPVLVLQPSAIKMTPPGTAICPGGGQVGLKAAPGYAGYLWSLGSATTDSITVNQPGAYVVTVTDAAKCVGTASIVVGEGQKPTTFIQGVQAFCKGGSTTLSADLFLEKYAWSSGQKSPAIMVDVPGTYTVTVTNEKGCTGTASAVVSQLTAPVATLTVPKDSICASDTLVLFTAGGGKEYQFWLNGAAQGSFSEKKTFDLNNPADGWEVSVQVKAENGCEDRTMSDEGPGLSPILIAVLPQPSLSTAFITHIPTCPEDSVRVLVSLNGLPNGMYDISWRLGGGATQTASVFFFNKLGTLMLPPLPPGQHTCTMLGAALPGTGCPTAWPSSGAALTFNILAPVVTTLDTTICYTQAVDFCGKSYHQSGAYTCALKTAAGCDSTVVLQLQSVKEFEKELKVTICKGSTYDFYGQILMEAGYYQHALSGTQGCDSLLKLTLIEEVPSINGINKTICPGASYAVGDSVFSQPGKYVVRLKSPTSDCDSIIELDLKWVANPPSVDFPEDTLRRCSAATISLSPTVQNCSNCKYKWTGGAALPSIFVSPTASTVYTVTVTNATTTCTASAAVTVLVVPDYTSVVDTLLCLGEQLFGKVVLRDTSITIQEECGTLTLNVEVADDPPFTARQDELSLSLNSTASTVFNVAAELLANDLPQPIGKDRVLSIVRGPRLGTAVLSADGGSLTYTPPPGGVLGRDSLRYSICPPSGCPAGCDSAWVILRLQNGDLQWVEDNMPNLITPGEVDGENDVFDPLEFLKTKGGIVPDDEGSVRLYLFNRWGEVVYRPYPYQLWDGLYGRGDGQRPLPQATYYYLLQFKIGDKQEQIRGAVNLLR